MDNVSSFIDGSIAIAGMIAGLAVSLWALKSSESAETDLANMDEAARGLDAPRRTKRQAA